MSFKAAALKLGAIGDVPENTDEERLHHRLVVFMGILMSGGGILWGSIAASFDLLIPAIVPYGYVVLTVFNLLFFKTTKNFAAVRFFQVLISLLLPFFFQWSLGGFESSGSVMLWAMLALVGSLTFTDGKSGIMWLVLYVAFTVGTGFIDAAVFEQFSNHPPAGVRTAFFTINITVISSIVFGLMIYLQVEKERANAELKEANARVEKMNEELEDLVAERTRELRSSLGQSKAILDNMADGLVAMNSVGRVEAVNPVFNQLLMRDGDIIGQDAREILPSEIAVLAERCCKSGDMETIEVALPGERIGLAVASPINADEQEKCEGVVVILRDVTLEKEIDRMKTDFIATVSHELRTPLTSILGFAKLTKNKLETQVLQHVPADDKRANRAAKQVSGNVDIIISEGDRLTNLINDVLDISKMEAGHMEWEMEMLDPTGLVERARDSASGLFTSTPVKLKLEIEDNLPMIRGDHDRLLQVLLNLISNASKFTEEGSVTVTARTTSEGVEFAVRDTGEGIAKEDLSTVFEKFRQVGDTLTNKPKGTGLGLPICRQIINSHHGRIWADSEVGTGSVFTFVVPSDFSVVEDSKPTMETLVDRIDKHVKRQNAEGDLDVLVVDDDPSLRELLTQQLGERGYSVRLAENGTAAIQAARKRRPDLVLLDVMMPGISGFDVAAVLKSDPETQNIPIIILSIVQDRDRGYRLGVESYLTKPTDSDRLIEEIERVMREARSKKNMLVVDPDPALDYKKLELRGYVIVGECHSDKCVDEADRLRPDVIIFGTKPDNYKRLIEQIRNVRGLEKTHVVSFIEDKDKIVDET